MENKKPVIAFFDIETSPLLSWNWGTFDQNAIAVKEEWYILSFAVKLGDSKTKVYSLDKMSEKELVKKLWEVFDSADILVAHNARKFDIKKANARFIFYGLTPPSPYKVIDTLTEARKHFKFTSNRLDSLGEYLGVGRKMKHQGIDLWFNCMNGDKKAFRTMRRYNAQDVNLLYEVYLKLRPYMTNHPSMTVYEERNGCPSCKSEKLQSRGFGVTKTGKHRRFQCLDCGSWCRGKNIKTETGISS